MHHIMHDMHIVNQPSSELIRSARKIRSLSQQSFALELGKSQGLVSRYERGLVDPPTDVLMHCMNILSQQASPTSPDFESAISGVSRALEALGHALEALRTASVSARHTSSNDAPKLQITMKDRRP